jgi:hypothetical protein
LKLGHPINTFFSAAVSCSWDTSDSVMGIIVIDHNLHTSTTQYSTHRHPLRKQEFKGSGPSDGNFFEGL